MGIMGYPYYYGECRVYNIIHRTSRMVLCMEPLGCLAAQRSQKLSEPEAREPIALLEFRVQGFRV